MKNGIANLQIVLVSILPFGDWIDIFKVGAKEADKINDREYHPNFIFFVKRTIGIISRDTLW